SNVTRRGFWPDTSLAQMSPVSGPVLRTNARLRPSGETAGIVSPSVPSGGAVIGLDSPPPAGITTIADGGLADLLPAGFSEGTFIGSSSKRDLPSGVQGTIGPAAEKSGRSTGLLNSTTVRSLPPCAGTTMYCVRPSASLANASQFPSGDHAGPTSFAVPPVKLRGLPPRTGRTTIWKTSRSPVRLL